MNGRRAGALLALVGVLLGTGATPAGAANPARAGTPGTKPISW